MKTALFSALAFSACASLAVAEDGSTAAGADQAGPVTLSEAQMDQVTAGGDSDPYAAEFHWVDTTATSFEWPPDDESRVWALSPATETD